MHSLVHYFKSIHWKIQLWHGILLAIILASFCAFSIKSAYKLTIQKNYNELSEYIPLLSNIVYNDLESASLRAYYDRHKQAEKEPADIIIVTRWDLIDGRGGRIVDPAKVDTTDLFKPHLAKRRDERIQNMIDNHQYFIIYSPDRSIYMQSENAPKNHVLPTYTPLTKEFQEAYDYGNYYEIEKHIYYGYVLIVGVDKRFENHFLELKWTITLYVLSGIGFFIFSFIGGWWLTSKALTPIKTISRQVEKISLGKLAERIEEPNSDNEFNPLISSLNHTLERLEKSFLAQKQFVADASHELRTPITVISAQIQMALHDLDTVEEYRETLLTCDSALTRMTKLVEGLLTLAKIDSTAQDNQNSRINVSKVLNETIAILRPLAKEREITINGNIQAARCAGREESFTSAISNLISNAIYYNRQGGRIDVQSKVIGKKIIISIADTGIGIPAKDLPHIFERFYRVDKSRSRHSGFSGLGLSIVKETINSLKGKLDIESVDGEGTKFTITLDVAE